LEWESNQVNNPTDPNPGTTVEPLREIVAALDASAMSTEQKTDLVLAIAMRRSWAKTSPMIEGLLLSSRKLSYAEVLAGVYFTAALEGLDFNCARVVALLLNCGIKSGTSAYNQVLSICVEKKGVEYQGGYAPDDDPEIVAELKRIRNG
jgi:hypothetical protein